jgi:hypothetical protein
VQRQDGGSTAVGGIGAGSRTAALPWEMTVMSNELRLSGLPSRHVTQGPQQAPSRAMMYGTGVPNGGLDQPLVGVFTTWNNASPCNMGLRSQSDENNMLDHRFSVAPMVDWMESFLKSNS